MPLLDSDFDQRFVNVKPEDTVAKALGMLRARAGGDDWHFFIEWPGHQVRVLGVDRLRAYLAQLGPALFQLTFEQLGARIPAASTAQQNRIGIGTAEDRALNDPQGILVVMRGGDIVGRLYRATRRGGDPFPGSTMVQLYGDYIDTHLDARAQWQPQGVEPPTCPHCGHIGYYRYRVEDGMDYCDHCGDSIER
jgi:hypothetical protein